MADSFASRFEAVRGRCGPLVWGLDPSGDLLDRWGFGDSPDGLDRFVDIVVEAAVGAVGLVKPQAAFYERHGWREVRARGLLAVLDAKRGDALTVHPYLGPGAMHALVTRAADSGSCLLVVTRSSNPEGRGVQAAVDGSASVEQRLLDEIGRLNASLSPGTIGPIGAVIGATRVEPALDLLAPDALFLAPGVGFQGTVLRSTPSETMRAASPTSSATR